MKKITLFILLFVAACSIYPATAKQAKKPAKPQEIIAVGIHRTVCFGKCPDYKIEINKDGTATYTAIRFTEDTGIFKKNIGKNKAKEIIALCVKYRIDTCREMYENRIPDLPGLNFTINYGTRKKAIFSANFGPDFLTEIAKAIDEAGQKTDANNTGWKKTGMPKID